MYWFAIPNIGSVLKGLSQVCGGFLFLYLVLDIGSIVRLFTQQVYICLDCNLGSNFQGSYGPWHRHRN